ncbi:alkaline phosphatase family protein [Anaeroselena agilis]|uniref:Alkaline phosphatase family protein n=1 Tax=Anaeroselena agilis TaxID=3063788 RepID=A0ABU3NVZ0_9FIRM|nr:alkaline phosphatase family protein [Selenomonadales bacterium 4137-cl]
MRRVLLIFIDGLGLGENDPDTNPLVRFDPPFFRALFGKPLTKDIGLVLGDEVCLVPTDASLGVPGLPQSATGQTAIFTGVNAPRRMGCHILGFPGPALAEIIAAHGLPGELAAAGFSVTSANMYTADYMELVARRKRRHSVTTLSILGAGADLRSLSDMAAGEAVYQDITNEMLPKFGVEGVPTVSSVEAGFRLAALAGRHDFTMFEYFQTDRQGHKHDWTEAAKIVATLDGFLAAVHRAAKDILVVITSDHGNFEDFTTKTHTLNSIPTILFGPDCRQVAVGIGNLTDIKPGIISYLKEGEVNG